MLDGFCFYLVCFLVIRIYRILHIDYKYVYSFNV